jgi:copper chaperone
MAEAILRVTDMTCGGCVRAITSAVTRAAPTAEIAVSLDEKSVTVLKGDPASVAAAVKAAGFEVELAPA